ncbi:hypothetical protein [Paenibacillus hexagrammi]|uniref:Essential protein Yae1 N-terminal domain-containing protein n=1 Tax=Paenibacillus hexagrammi TaxID=2908839 RepID=A0ABY3STS5_9BACL|nr:hypothetical protein [Paenibacillus sp. YPD9-1]UJF36546.1 hypothetical protein L0M14_30630 [Paenibacillus sp. YPD9-1]
MQMSHRPNTTKQRKTNSHPSTKQREQKRAAEALVFREGYDMGYNAGLAEGLRRGAKKE